MKRRILAGLLSLCMLAGLMPGTAWAETPQTAEHTHNEDGWVCTEQAAEPTLVCTQEEHTHTSDCYDADGALICTLEEHTHTDDCWQQGESSWTCTAPAEGEQDGKVETPGDQQNGGSVQTPQAPDNTENPNTPEENPSKAPAGPQVTDNGAAPDEGESEPQSPDNGEQPLSETRDTGEVLATYVSADGSVMSEGEVSLEAAVDALNEAGGGTITVTQSGTVKSQIHIKSDITIVADGQVTIKFEPNYDPGLFLIGQTEKASRTLTLGADDMEDGSLTFDGLGGDNPKGKTTLVQAWSHENTYSTLKIKNGVLVRGFTDNVVDFIYSSDGFTVEMSGGEIANNDTEGAVIETENFIMSGGYIHDNTSGGKTFDELAYNTSNTTITSTIRTEHLKMTGGLIENCISYYGAIEIKDIGEERTSCFTGNARIHNCAGLYTGGIYTASYFEEDPAELIIGGNAEISNCVSVAGKYIEDGVNAGAIYADFNLTIQDNARIVDCASIKTDDIENWDTEDIGAGAGAILLKRMVDDSSEPATATIKGNAYISGNKGGWGGGILSLAGYVLQVKEDAQISENTATRAGGGIMLANCQIGLLTGDTTYNNTLVVNGGRITGNTAPQGGGIYVTGNEEKILKIVALEPNEYTKVLGNSQLELREGANVTGNTATEQGGGIWVGWEVSPKISGAIHVADNTLEDGSVNDIYLDRDPDALPDPDEPEWGEGSEVPEAPEEPETPAVIGLLEFVQTKAKDAAKESMTTMTDEDVVEEAKSLNYLEESVTAGTLPKEEIQSLRTWLEEQIAIDRAYTSSGDIIARYREEQGINPSLEDFKQTVQTVYADYMESDIKKSLGYWKINPNDPNIVEMANILGLPVSDDDCYTGTEAEFWTAYKKYMIESKYGETTDEDWRMTYNAFFPEEAPEKPEEPVFYDARMEVTAPLTGSQIGVFVAGARSGRVFAYGNEYTLTPEDLDVFTVENPGYIGAGTVANTLVLKRPAVEIAPAKPGDDNNNNNNTTKNNVTVTDKADAPAPAAAAPSAAASGAAIPQTGDTLPVGLLGGVAAVAVAAFVVLLVLRKRKHDD